MRWGILFHFRWASVLLKILKKHLSLNHMKLLTLCMILLAPLLKYAFWSTFDLYRFVLFLERINSVIGWDDYLPNRILVLKRHQLESTVKQNMAPFPEEMEPYTFVFLTKDTVKRFGTMLLDALLLQVKQKIGVIKSLLDFSYWIVTTNMKLRENNIELISLDPLYSIICRRCFALLWHFVLAENSYRSWWSRYGCSWECTGFLKRKIFGSVQGYHCY